MPDRRVASYEIAQFYNLLAHPVRIQIVFELKKTNRDVASLAKLLEVQASTLSQHLSHLKNAGIVFSNRDGHHVIYSLSQPVICDWILDSLTFLQQESERKAALSKTIKKAQQSWV
jgi:DNA-binding transcriptional ArsR family regulator